jgi:hypothetical protein
MNPRPGANVFINPLVKMLPLLQEQTMVYRFAEAHPPGFEDGFGPIWEVASFALAARQTAQVRINFQREFHLLAITASSSQAGGFRGQIYDQRAKRRMADRGVNWVNAFGPGAHPFMLREPYCFAPDPKTRMDAQVLVIVQNQDTSTNTNLIQVVLYGVARRFNFPA